MVLLQSLNESQIPDSLLERLVASTKEFPPVSAVLGGILGQVNGLSNYCGLCFQIFDSFNYFVCGEYK